jgi:peptide/nickel transport system permease protein
MRVHALRNALIPVVTVLGIVISRLLGGSVLVEVVFAIPGIGSLGAQAILQRDLITVQGVVLMMALAVTFVDVATDAAYTALDPRIRYG